MNTGGIIILIAVLLFCIYEIVSLSLTIAKKRKKKKGAVEDKVAESNEDKNNEKGGIADDRNSNNAVGD